MVDFATAASCKLYLYVAPIFSNSCKIASHILEARVLDATFKLIVMLLVRGTTFSPNMVKLLASDGMATAIERKTKGGYADLPFKESQKSLFLTFLVKHDDTISFCTVLYRSVVFE